MRQVNYLDDNATLSTKRGLYYKLHGRWFKNCLPVDSQSDDPDGPNYVAEQGDEHATQIRQQQESD